MRNLICFSLLLLAVNLNLYSQDPPLNKPIAKGNLITGGDLDFGFSNSISEITYLDPVYTSESKSTNLSLSINPKIGYFITNGLAIGFMPSFEYRHSKYTNQSIPELDPNEGHGIGTGISIFIKYYLKNCIFFELESGYTSYKSKSTGDYVSSNRDFKIIPSFGYAIFINQKVSIEPKINYEFHDSLSDSPDVRSNGQSNKFSFTMGFNIFI